MNDLIPIILFSIATMITPGPNNLMVMNSGLNFGIKKSLPHYFGVCLGFPLMVLVVALGLGTVFEKYIWLKHILKIIGSAYILYLALQILKTSAQAKIAGLAKPLSMLQAILFQWVNPKAWLMAIGAISIYAIAENYFYNAVAISVLFFFVCLPCLLVWLVFGVSLQKILKEERHVRYFNIFMAMFLVASIMMIVFDN